jgi:hypothetical protein
MLIVQTRSADDMVLAADAWRHVFVQRVHEDKWCQRRMDALRRRHAAGSVHTLKVPLV